MEEIIYSIYVNENNKVIGIGESNTEFPDAQFYFNNLPDKLENMKDYKVVKTDNGYEFVKINAE